MSSLINGSRFPHCIFRQYLLTAVLPPAPNRICLPPRTGLTWKPTGCQLLAAVTEFRMLPGCPFQMIKCWFPRFLAILIWYFDLSELTSSLRKYQWDISFITSLKNGFKSNWLLRQWGALLIASFLFRLAHRPFFQKKLEPFFHILKEPKIWNIEKGSNIVLFFNHARQRNLNFLTN